MVLRKLSQTFKISLALILTVLTSGMPTAVTYATAPEDNGQSNQPVEKKDQTPPAVQTLTTNDNNGGGQETCPNTTFTNEAGGWVKYDGLSGTSYPVPQKTGFTVTQICYKSSTTVNYPAVSATVTSTVTNQHGQVQDLSHVSVYYTKNVVNPCEANYFPVQQMWEITWGRQFSDTGSLPTFTMDSNGGLTSLNDGPVPAYMTNAAQWHWLYVTVANVQNGRTVKYGFADGTVRTAVVGADANNCPSVVWTETPPPTVEPCRTTTGPEMVTKESDFADYNDTRAKGHYEFTANGLRIYTEDSSSLSKVAWYNSVTPYSLSKVGEPSIDFELSSGTVKPGMQIALDADGNGTFDGYLVGEPDFYGNNWWSNANFGVGSGMGYNSYGTLNEYLAANPNAKVMAVGFSLGSGVKADGVLKSLTIGCHQWVFKKKVVAVTTCPVVLNTNHSTNLNNNGWTLPADAEYVSGGVRLNVSGAWDETYIERSFVGPLADIGNQVDFTANPNQYAGIHIVTSKGVLVYEKEGTYAGKWWSTSDFGVASGMGYQTFDTLANIVAANPDVTTSALRVLYTSPLVGSSTISTVTVGCTIYTFDKVAGGVGGDTPIVPTTPGQVLGDSTGKTLSASTVLPSALPATGNATNPFMIMIASIVAYGAAYFLNGRRQISRKLDV